MIEAQIDALTKRARGYLDSIPNETPPEITTLIHRYLCTLLTSNIDRAIHLILTEFARTRGNEQLKRFVSQRLSRATNYNTETMTQLLNSLDPTWGERFASEAINSELKEQLDAMYGLRNSIAHGVQVGVSRSTLDGYYKAQDRIIALVKTIVIG